MLAQLFLHFYIFTIHRYCKMKLNETWPITIRKFQPRLPRVQTTGTNKLFHTFIDNMEIATGLPLRTHNKLSKKCCLCLTPSLTILYSSKSFYFPTCVKTASTKKMTKRECMQGEWDKRNVHKRATLTIGYCFICWWW